MWPERTRRAHDGMTELDPALITASPCDAFRHVPADGPWNGMTLLRDQAE